MPIVESGAASLGIGAISDGQYLKRSGTNIIGAAVGGGGTPSSLFHVQEIFDGLATGDINGLGSYYECGAWVTGNAATCTSTVAVKSGADKMLRLFAPVGAGTAACGLTLTSPVGLMFGSMIRFKIRTDQDATGFSGGVLIGDSVPNTKASVRFGYSTGLKLRFYDGTTTTNYMAAAKDTWYQIDMVIVNIASNVYARVFIDGAIQALLGCGTQTATWPTVRAYCTNTAASGDLNLDIDDLEVWNLYPTGL
jgi:hypothetical protein